jgi:hypothetical protein
VHQPQAPPEISNNIRLVMCGSGPLGICRFTSKLLGTSLSMVAFKTSLAISINADRLLLCKHGPRESLSELENPTMARKRHNQNFRLAIVKNVKAGLMKRLGVET